MKKLLFINMKTVVSYFLVVVFVIFNQFSFAQKRVVKWTKDGVAYMKMEEGNLVKVDPRNDQQKIIVKKESFFPTGSSIALDVEFFDFNTDNTKLLLFVNSAKVWRYNTRGDYWVLDLVKNKLHQLGKGLNAQSLLFAKFSPDSKNVAYVSDHNIFSEDVNTGIIHKLTTDGTRKLINGTFDWVYEEEFGCRDGFRWSADSRQIALWQVDATKTRDFYMLIVRILCIQK